MFRKMSRISVFLMLLFLFTCGDSAQVKWTSNPAVDVPLAETYNYTDHRTGITVTCDKCPAGTYVSKHCTDTNLRECSPCQNGTYTKRVNGIERCHRCQEPCLAPFIEKRPCTALSDRECTCSPGFFINNETCRPHSQCSKGWGVRRKGSQVEDVKCRTCPRGTFSDVSSSVLKCRTHTNCTAQGLAIIFPGTRETDNSCGAHPSHSFTSLAPVSSAFLEASSADFAQKDIFNSTTGGQDSTSESLLTSTVTEPSDTTVSTSDNDSQHVGSLATKQDKATESPRRHHKHHRDYHSHQSTTKLQPVMETLEDSRVQKLGYKPTRRGSPRPSAHKHFDINEHLPWMIVLFILLVLVIIVVCSVKRSSRVLKKGPRQDPSSIMEKAIQKKPAVPTPNKEKWIYYSSGQGVDILKLVSAQMGSQWIDMYQYLANATEREVAAFSNGYTADHERAYAALQHWTIRDADANLAKLINALRRHRRNDVVEKIRGVMEDNPQFDLNHLMTSVNVAQCPSPTHKPSESMGVVVEHSPVDRTKGFFVDESEPLLRCDSTSSNNSALSRTGSFITKEKKDTVLRQVRLDPCDLQPIFDDMLHILNPEELHIIEEIPSAEDKLDKLFEIAGVKSQEASQKLLDSVYSHLPDLL
ncbi:tumor necrosis factor receptor superfamily member 21 [Lepisosteus oculatus]|uniref:tumor necrosis factor receptor superfamily member 21 n=1 Tax=Lepisosteus oculatus TaxID=7918 RepID=UPI00073FFEF5|nr:PREDICTED: tumor necrosis factor receptor superfamily member 21 [Lepisosteus oculatus]